MKIKGTFCEIKKAPKAGFARASFRWKKNGRAWLLVGCSRGQWSARARRCRVGTRAHVLLIPVSHRGRCTRGKRVTKGG